MDYQVQFINCMNLSQSHQNRYIKSFGLEFSIEISLEYFTRLKKTMPRFVAFVQGDDDNLEHSSVYKDNHIA